MLSGCGGPSQQVLSQQTLAQIQESNPNKALQPQVTLPPVTQSSGVSYKDYQVGPEDLLVLEIYGQDKLSRTVRVGGQGDITMPLVGVVKVAGLTPQEIEKRMVKLYDDRFLVNPQVTVTVKEFRYQRVSVTGAVAKPGTYELIGPRPLLEVLSLAGGLGSQTSQVPAGDVVNVIRHQSAPAPAGASKTGTSQTPAPPETVVIDLRRLVSGQSPELNILVRNGDVVHVPFADTAYVMGGVKKPGNIAVKENLTVSQAVALAGGIDPLLGTNNITIMRFDKQGSPTTIRTNLNSIMANNDPDIPIKGSDVVMVNVSPFKKTLYLFRALLPQPTFPMPY
jgi:polysaccharide export outer membrane protein